MSRGRKRRKKSKSKNDLDLDIFQTEICDIIPSVLLNLASIPSNGKRFEINEKERKETLSSEEKKKMIVIKGHVYLEKFVLDRMKVGPLRRFYNKFVERGNCPDKKTMIKVLSAKFFGKETNLEKRESERKLIEDSSLDRLFVTMCGITIPVEIINGILSFLVCDKTLLFDSLGSVCKDFYVSVLMNWSKLEMRKGRVRNISLLTLQNIRNLVFREKLVAKDYGHIWKNIKSEIICVIDISGLNLFHAVKVFLKSLNGIVFPNTFELKFGYVKDVVKKLESRKMVFDLNETFPNLRNVSNPFNLKYLEKCKKLRYLKIDCFDEHFSAENFQEYVTKELLGLDMIIWAGGFRDIGPKDMERLVKIVTNFGKLRKLCFVLNYACNLEVVKNCGNKFLEGLVDLKELDIPFYLKDYNVGCLPIEFYNGTDNPPKDARQQLKMIKSKFPNLKKVEVRIPFKESENIVNEYLSFLFGRKKVIDFKLDLNCRFWTECILHMNKKRRVMKICYCGKKSVRIRESKTYENLMFKKLFQNSNHPACVSVIMKTRLIRTNVVNRMKKIGFQLVQEDSIRVGKKIETNIFKATNRDRFSTSSRTSPPAVNEEQKWRYFSKKVKNIN